MNLVIDAGNTLFKMGVFENNDIIEQWKGETVDWDAIYSLYTKYPIDAAIVSDVSGITKGWVEELMNKARLIIMTPEIITPLKINYESPETLGTDRLAAAVYAASLYPGLNTLTIQTGTCITYDIVDSMGQYLGGGISPGLDMRFRAMHTFTANLPLVKKEKIAFLTGKNTSDSILSGVINGTSAEIDGIIDQYKEIFPELMVVLGGGDTFFFDKRLKNRIFATANLVLKGLNIILEHNK